MILGDSPRRQVVLDRFAALEDDCERWRVAHPLPEGLLLVVCGMIGTADDFDEIIEWGETNCRFCGGFRPIGGVDPVWWTPLSSDPEVSHAALPSRLSA